MVSELFDPDRWTEVTDEFDDVTYHRARETPAVRIAFDRPAVRNAFRPGTVDELAAALDHARRQADVGCVLLTGNGPSPEDGGWAFSAGGDQSVRGDSGYEYRGDDPADPEEDPLVRRAEAGRLHVLGVQRRIRFMPKPVVAVVPGWAVGGGHSLHVVCDLTLASAEHARFKQTDPDVASFDGGFGSALLARQIGQKRAREIFFLGKEYDAETAVEMGLANEAVPHERLEERALEAAATMAGKSPTAMRMLKYAFNLADDGLVGQQLFAGEATRLAYATDEAAEGRDAFVEGREPDFSGVPWHY
jgi:naphthoate synthase